MKKNKGISLIVLVITIIVMIILAGTIILSLNNSGIIGKAQDAVDAANLNEVKNLANVAWAEAYMKGARTEAELNDAVKEALTKNNITEDHYKGYTLLVTAKGVDFANKSLNPSGVIPEDGTYYVGVTSTNAEDYTGATATYTAGDNFPSAVATGDVYVYGYYEYRYNQYYGYDSTTRKFIWNTDNTQNGWGVRCLATKGNDDTVGSALETINNKYITNMNYAFYYCDIARWEEGFTIPNSVTNMRGMFNQGVAPNLPDTFTIPYGVTDLSDMFYDCSIALPSNITIPDSVTDMIGMFEMSTAPLPASFTIPNGVINIAGIFCGSTLTELPEGFTIPASVKDMSSAFDGCENLTGTIIINANPTSYDNCFWGTKK